MKIQIDEEKCIGCGNCVPNCHMGIIQIIDGKARVNDLALCDGMGRCIGHCPTGALSLVEEVLPPDPQTAAPTEENLACGCPGSHVRDLRPHSAYSGPLPAFGKQTTDAQAVSELRQWPIQLKLVPPSAPFLRGADLVIAADCTAFSRADFHDRFIRGRTLCIACPKLDADLPLYSQKLMQILSTAQLRSLQVIQMEVPCCNGLFQIAYQAWVQSGRPTRLKRTVIGVEGQIIHEEEISD